MSDYPALKLYNNTLRIFSSVWCMRHSDKAWSPHQEYKGAMILRGYNDLELTRPSTVYRATVEVDALHQTQLYGENLDVIRQMIRLWREHRLTWREV